MVVRRSHDSRKDCYAIFTVTYHLDESFVVLDGLALCHVFALALGWPHDFVDCRTRGVQF